MLSQPAWFGLEAHYCGLHFVVSLGSTPLNAPLSCPALFSGSTLPCSRCAVAADWFSCVSFMKTWKHATQSDIKIAGKKFEKASKSLVLPYLVCASAQTEMLPVTLLTPH